MKHFFGSTRLIRLRSRLYFAGEVVFTSLLFRCVKRVSLVERSTGEYPPPPHSCDSTERRAKEKKRERKRERIEVSFLRFLAVVCHEDLSGLQHPKKRRRKSTGRRRENAKNAKKEFFLYRDSTTDRTWDEEVIF